MKRKDAGFQEIEHTADWALQVWAPDLPILFTLAAEGMNSLAEVKLAEGERVVEVTRAYGREAGPRKEGAADLETEVEEPLDGEAALRAVDEAIAQFDLLKE